MNQTIFFIYIPKENSTRAGFENTVFCVTECLPKLKPRVMCIGLKLAESRHVKSCRIVFNDDAMNNAINRLNCIQLILSMPINQSDY